MSKRILNYTIRTHKKDNRLIEIFIKNYPTFPTFTRPFMTFSVMLGFGKACYCYYSHQTRPATEKEIEIIKDTTLKIFKGLYGDDYELQYFKRLPR
jgi:hypothetical protein